MKIIFINGAPASGKTTLVDAIKNELTPVVIRKDIIKEHLFDTLGTHGEEWSRMLGVNISKFVIMLADDILRSGRSVVIEGAFHRDLARKDIEWLQNNHKGLEVVEIYCEVHPDILKTRFEERVRHEGYHPLSMGEVETLQKYEPIGMGKLIRVDTTDPRIANRQELISEINS
jgi:predicted kinase